MVDISNIDITAKECGSETHYDACPCRQAYFRRIELALLFYCNPSNYTREARGGVLGLSRVELDDGKFARLALGLDKPE